MFQKRNLPNCAGASTRQGGLIGKRSRMNRKACRWRQFRNLPAIGRQTTIGARCEAKLNALPQFITEIDGLDIHFIHVRSKHENALPLIVTHGWPGSVIEQLKIIDPLTNPTAHGGSASDAFHLVIPSLPGFGFSARPTTSGWGPERTATCLGRADEAPWIHAICGARRRSGCGCLHCDGQTGASGIAGHSHQLPGNNSIRHREGASGRRPTAIRSLRRRKTRLRAAHRPVCEATCLRTNDGERARKRCMDWRIRRSAWQPGCLTTAMVMANRRRR